MSQAAYDPSGIRLATISPISGTISAGETIELFKVPAGMVARLNSITYTLHVAATTNQASGMIQYLDPGGHLLYEYTPSGLQNSYAAAVAVVVTGFAGNNTDIFQFSSNNADGVLEQCNLLDQWLGEGCSCRIGAFSFHQGETLDGIVAGIEFQPAQPNPFRPGQIPQGNAAALAYLLHTP